MNIFKTRLKQTIKECALHVKRMNSAFNKIKPFTPLTGEKLSNLSEDEIEHIDQYLFRFSKLQDAMGQRLFKNVLLALGEIIEGKSFIDVFDRLEQLEIIDDYDKWLELRVVRNELSHEYEDNPEENTSELNKILNMKDDLLNYFYSIEKFVLKKRLLVN